MKLNKLAAVTAAAALTVAPLAAQTTDSVSSPVERISGTSANAEKLEGENGILIALLASAAIIAGIIIIADDDEPTSP